MNILSIMLHVIGAIFVLWFTVMGSLVMITRFRNKRSIKEIVEHYNQCLRINLEAKRVLSGGFDSQHQEPFSVLRLRKQFPELNIILGMSEERFALNLRYRHFMQRVITHLTVAFSEKTEPFYSDRAYLHRVKLKQDSLLIEECIAKNDSFTGFGITISLRDTKTYKVVCFHELLPSGSLLGPGVLLNYERLKSFDFNLTDYKGGHVMGNGRFCNLKMPMKSRRQEKLQAKYVQVVSYGDISTDGGRFSLLHEMGHAWALHQKGGFQELERYIESIEYSRILLDIYELKLKVNPYEAKLDKTLLKVQKLKKKLKEKDWVTVPLGGEVKRKRKMEDIVFFRVGYVRPNLFLPAIENIRSKKLFTLIAQAVESERTAWARAIKTIRYLRRQGIDIEPNMKTRSEILDYVHECLYTYQIWVDTYFPFLQGYKRFTRRKASTSDLLEMTLQKVEQFNNPDMG